MSIESKIDKVLDIWVAKGSLAPTPSSRNKKFNEIMEKVLCGTYKESDLDLFIERSITGFYENERRKKNS